MGFSSSTQWEFQTTGDNANGGGFYNADPGVSVDYPLANTSYAYTDIVIDAVTNTKITSATRPFVGADAGNIINITAGTGFTVQRVQITSVDGSNVATCDKAVGTVASTGGTGTLGGALAVPTDALLELNIAGNTWWVKADTYTFLGNISVAAGGAYYDTYSYLIGYSSTRGDNPTMSNRPFFAMGGYGLVFTGDYWVIKNIAGIGSYSYCVCIDRGSIIDNCSACNISTTAGRTALISTSNSLGEHGIIIKSEGVSINGIGIDPGVGVALFCYAHDSATGIQLTFEGAIALGCISAYCTTYGVKLSGNVRRLINSTVVGSLAPGSVGIYGSSNALCSILGNIISNWGTGANLPSTSSRSHTIDYNNWYNNTVDVVNITKGENDIALDPQFVAVGNQGNNLCTNGADWTGATGSTPPTGWAVVTAGTFTITASGQAGDYLKIAHNGTNNNPGISFAITTEVGKSYLITYYAQKGTATNLTAKIGTTSGGTEIGYTAAHTDTDWNTQKSVSFEATATTTYFSVGATTSTNGQYSMIDTVIIYEQGEDFTPGANMQVDIDWTKIGL